MEEVIREGRWTCPACGKKNRGRAGKCAGCGQARGDVEFELDESAAEVTEAADLAAAHAGADWVCAYCSTSNVASAGACKQCAAARAEGKQREEKDVPPPAVAPLAQAAAFDPRGAARILGGFALVFALLVWMAFRTHEERLTLRSVHWQRSIAVEELRWVQEDGWSVPSGGRELSSSQQVHHVDRVPDGTRTVMQSYTERVQTGTRRVKTGTRNLGNGFFKDVYAQQPVYSTEHRTRPVQETVYRDVPVYRTRYHYEIERWVASRRVDTSGDDTAPKWGDFTAGARERAGPRTETLSAVLEGGGNTHPWNPDAATFGRLKVGDAYRVELNGMGAVQRLLE